VRSSPLPVLASLCVAALSAACATVRASSSHDPAVDFAAYRTFAVAPTPATAPHLPGYSALTGASIRQRVGSQLEAKGLAPTDEATADLVVRVEVSGLPRSDIVGSPQTGFGAGDVYTVNYVEGTLVIDMVDRRRDTLVWHGWATDDLFESDVRAGRITDMVDAILARYPPAAGR
jgi:Domain of unknown function (DUF4136)